MAFPLGRITGPSPATHVPIGPADEEIVALVISGSPGSKLHPSIDAAVRGAVASLADGRMVSTLSVARLKAAVKADRTAAVGDVLGSPAGNPPSTHETIRAASSGVSVGSLANAPYPRAACHLGMRRVNTCSLTARAHGRTCSYVVSGIGADPRGAWQGTQRDDRIARISRANVTLVVMGSWAAGRAPSDGSSRTPSTSPSHAAPREGGWHLRCQPRV